MSDLSLHENNISMEAGDTPRSKTKKDVFETTGEIGEMETTVIHVSDTAKVVDEAGDAGRECVKSGQTWTQKELGDDKEGTLVPGCTTHGDVSVELLEQDLDTTGRLNELDEDEEKEETPVMDGTTIGDISVELLEQDMASDGPPKKLEDDKEARRVSDRTAVGEICVEPLDRNLATAGRLKELDEEKEPTPVPDGTAVGDICVGLLEQDLGTTRRLNELDEEKKVTAVSDGTADRDLYTELLEHDPAATGTPEELDGNREATPVPHGTGVEDLCAEMLKHDVANAGPLKELGEDKEAIPVPQGTTVVDLCEELLEHAMFTAGPRKELREDEATPAPQGTTIGDLCAEMLKHDVAIAGSPEKPDGEQAAHDANASPVALRVAAEEQKPPPKNLQARVQPGSVSDLVHAESGKDDARSQYSSGFLTHLTEEEFARAPKYAKGALSLGMVQNLVDSFNEALATKYRLLALPKSQVPKLQRGRVSAYREQETAESKQLRFLVESDLTGKGGLFGSRRTAASFFLLMRHCRKMREVRGPGSIVRYAVH